MSIEHPYIKNVYVAASFAYEDRDKTQTRKLDIERVINKIKQKLEKFDINFYLPHQLKIPNAWDMSLEEWAKKVFDHDYYNLMFSDLVIFISYGKENNSGSVWECGYAYAKGIPTIVIKMTNDVESLMITNTTHAIIMESDIDTYDFVNLPVVKINLEKLS